MASANKALARSPFFLMVNGLYSVKFFRLSAELVTTRLNVGFGIYSMKIKHRRY
jgi:hypothetical protein